MPGKTMSERIAAWIGLGLVIAGMVFGFGKTIAKVEATQQEVAKVGLKVASLDSTITYRIAKADVEHSILFSVEKDHETRIRAVESVLAGGFGR